MNSSRFLKDAGIKRPIICGAMYPCSNFELVAAASEAGGLGVVQPLSLTFVQKLDFREGLKKIKRITNKPIAVNMLTEKSVKKYEDKMKEWLDISLEEGVRFFVSSLGNPGWIVKKVVPLGGKVYHDVTSLKWAQKAVDAGVHGLICVNNKAGGHAGLVSAEDIFTSLQRFSLPLIAAGGVSNAQDARHMLRIGYEGVQCGTRFIASTECHAHTDYKAAVLRATSQDIVLTEKITGIPVSVILTDFVKKQGLELNWLAKQILKHPRGKHILRAFYSLQSLWQLKNASQKGNKYREYYQAGKSVDRIDCILSVDDIMAELAKGCVLT